MIGNCKNCRFWREHKDEHQPALAEMPDTGECRRYAPQPARSQDGRIGDALAHLAEHQHHEYGAAEDQPTLRIAVWPITDADDWCGEQQPKEIT